MRTVGIIPPAAARSASDLLAELGFRTALDLELLGGGEAAAEVLEDLKAGGVSSADRAKIRVLVGDQDHLWRLASGGSWPERLESAASGTSTASGHDASASIPDAATVPSATMRTRAHDQALRARTLGIEQRVALRRVCRVLNLHFYATPPRLLCPTTAEHYARSVVA